MTLLRIDSSPIGPEASFSRQLTDEFVRRWKQAHPGGQILTRDLAATPLTPVNAEWIAAAYTPEAERTPRQREILSLSDELIAELQWAGEYVLGVPMHNFTIPGLLKLWIDQVVRAGKTFSYVDGQPVGLLQGKQATLILTSGGVYEPGTPTAAMDFAEPYLRSIFAFIGVSEVRAVRVGGTAMARDDAGRQAILNAARGAMWGEPGAAASSAVAAS
jgi:FMN-dependent NADH-azoreductase